jgi:hypothetical protein
VREVTAKSGLANLAALFQVLSELENHLQGE